MTRIAKTTIAMVMIVMGSLGFAFGAPTAPAAAPEMHHLKIGVGSKNGFFFLPTMVAEGLGYYKDAGLDVEIVDLGSGAKTLEGLVGGSVDVICDAFDHVVQLRAKQIDLQAFVLQGRLPDYAIAVVKSKEGAYKSPQDLRGMRIGISSPGSGSDMFLKLFLAKAGVKASEVSTISVGLGPTAVAAVRAGQLDAIANNDPVIGTLAQSGDIKVIADARTEAGAKDVYGGAYPAAALIAYKSFIDKNPKTTQALTNAMVRTLRWMSTATPDQIIAVMPKQFAADHVDTTRKILASLKQIYSADGLFPANSGEMAVTVLRPYVHNIDAAKQGLDTTFTNRFVQAADKP
jgi:NitT/TauT family transport system substrate-binding protein